MDDARLPCARSRLCDADHELVELQERLYRPDCSVRLAQRYNHPSHSSGDPSVLREPALPNGTDPAEYGRDGSALRAECLHQAELRDCLAADIRSVVLLQGLRRVRNVIAPACWPGSNPDR